MRFALPGIIILLLAGCLSMCARPTKLKLYMPKGGEHPEAHAFNPDFKLTLVLAKSNMILVYSGDLSSSTPIVKTDYTGVREIIARKKKALGDSLVILIKPAESATYKNTVDILDEMSIGEIKRYVLVDITSEEAELLRIQTGNRRAERK